MISADALVNPSTETQKCHLSDSEPINNVAISTTLRRRREIGPMSINWRDEMVLKSFQGDLLASAVLWASSGTAHAADGVPQFPPPLGPLDSVVSNDLL